MRSPLVAVLAGGQGRRLGGDKPATLLAGRPLIDYPLAAARAAGLEAVVVAKPSSELPALRVPVVLEPEWPQHPLCGLVAALAQFPDRRLLAVACDMAFVPALLLASLGKQEEGTVVLDVDGWLQPFPGLYAQSGLARLHAGLAAERPLRAVLGELKPTVLDESWLEPFGDPARICFSVNTPADLERAAHWLAEGAADRTR
jgi:molybdopterin-guanine dinucleotide biosynthesis protein A